MELSRDKNTVIFKNSRCSFFWFLDYRVGSEHAYSNVFSFKGLKERADGGYRYAVYGDFG